jgi:hypothetical protein
MRPLTYRGWIVVAVGVAGCGQGSSLSSASRLSIGGVRPVPSPPGPHRPRPVPPDENPGGSVSKACGVDPACNGVCEPGLRCQPSSTGYGCECGGVNPCSNLTTGSCQVGVCSDGSACIETPDSSYCHCAGLDQPPRPPLPPLPPLFPERTACGTVLMADPPISDCSGGIGCPEDEQCVAEDDGCFCETIENQ